ncbi:GspH/FimT family pseudopilin [uncultured Piscinibacter sp.]|uniref:GspH/FimT family pseudopilin n=1 Tax=uncultured Piscinibacter sp. TaxID=1131835 RepID=UPI0026192228|nr:GspH/FimT family pseudopilin [uncultured Piscinibacter sp.]
MSHLGTQRGLTLVEAAVVIGIVAAAATAAAPGLQRLIDLRRLDAAATQLVADLQLARNESIARNRVVRLSWHAATNCYVVHTGNADQCQCAADGQGRCSPGSTLIRSVGWTAAGRVGLQSNAPVIAFDPLHGTATPTATWRVVGSDGRAIHHVVNVMGRVRSCSPLAAVPGYRAC